MARDGINHYGTSSSSSKSLMQWRLPHRNDIQYGLSSDGLDARQQQKIPCLVLRGVCVDFLTPPL